MTQSSSSPSRSLMNAICFPSGDQEGSLSSRVLLVSCNGELPSPFIDQTSSSVSPARMLAKAIFPGVPAAAAAPGARDRKSTRLNSSHANISYAVFCLKKKKKKFNIITQKNKKKKKNKNR